MIDKIIDFEDKFYDWLLDNHNKFFKDRYGLEIFLCKAIIRVMNFLKEKGNHKFVQNALITIIILFNDIFPDFYNFTGEDVRKLSIEKKEQLIELLRSEIKITGTYL